MNREPNEYDRFESDLQHILQDHEVPFNPDDWALMEEQLRRKNGKFVPFLQKHKWLIVAGIALLFTTWQLKNRLDNYYEVAKTMPTPQALPNLEHVAPPAAQQGTTTHNPENIASPNHEAMEANEQAMPNIAQPISLPTQQTNSNKAKQDNMPTALHNPKLSTSGKQRANSHINAPVSELQTPNSQYTKTLVLNNDAAIAVNPKQMVSSEFIAHKSKAIQGNITTPPINNATNDKLLSDNAPMKQAEAVAVPQEQVNAKTQSHENAIDPSHEISKNELATETPSETNAALPSNKLPDMAAPTDNKLPENEEITATTAKKTTAEKTTAKKTTAIKKPKKRFTAFYATPTASIDGNFLNGRPLRLGYSAGLNLNYQFHRNFSIETGIAYSKKNYQMTAIFDNYQAVFPEQYRVETANLSFVEIPILLKFHLPTYTDECLPYIGIGNSILMPIKKQYNYSQIIPVPSMEVASMPDSIYYNAPMPDSNDNDLSTLWKNIHLQAGASFKLSKKLRLNIESQFKASLDVIQLGSNPVIQKHEEKYNLFSFGIQGGLSYKF
jgi:hypothetical protein